MSEPVSKAILLCNYATIDKVNRWSLIDTFNTVYMKSTPWMTNPFFVFVSVVDAPTVPVLTFQVEDASGFVVQTSGPIPFDSAGLRNLQFLHQVKPFVIVSPGKYRIVLYINKDRVAETELAAEMAPEGVPL